tara:strand:- start:284 stop:493 length:210 start_codon:yes stop_codon:yes gene_type:complete
MHSIKYIRENKEIILDCINQKKSDINLDEILDIDLRRRTLIQEVENLKADRNLINNKISNSKKKQRRLY